MSEVQRQEWETIPFSHAAPVPAGLASVADAVARGAVKAGGEATLRCEAAMQALVGGESRVLMLGSCTAALELSAMLMDVGPGDEIIMPSFGYPSAANAFVLRGGVPVFVDIDPENLWIDLARVADAITDRTRAIVPVHYAGFCGDLQSLMALADDHGVAVIEDAAQTIGSTYHGQALGTFGATGTVSFDATKNTTCGAGGALIINDPELIERAEWIRDCGTDRATFFRGHTKRYEWITTGSNLALGELAAAYLAPQLEGDAVAGVTRERQVIWDRYHAALAPAEEAGLLRRLNVPGGCVGNAHMYAFLLPDAQSRPPLLDALRAEGIAATFHFVPLHSAPGGLQYGRTHGPLTHTNDCSAQLVRLPLWQGLPLDAVDRIAETVTRLLEP